MRQLDQAAKITLIGEEQSLPYQRPPLSKKYMTGEMEAERLLLRPDDWYDGEPGGMPRHTSATAINLAAKTVTTPKGAIPFDKLLIATGSRPRKLPDAIGGNLARCLRPSRSRRCRQDWCGDRRGQTGPDHWRRLYRP